MKDAPRAGQKKAGRPRLLTKPIRTELYLDAATIDRARALGHGNVSCGVRIALSQTQEPATGSAGDVVAEGEPPAAT